MTIRLRDSRIVDAPDAPGWVRLVGDVEMEGPHPVSAPVWYQVPCEYAEALSLTGNPWLALLLPLAAVTGQPLCLALPVDRRLHEQAYELQQIWYSWGWTRQRRLPLEVDVYDPPPDAPRPSRTMLYYSGGVDSLFSLLTDTPEFHPERDWNIDDLLHVHGIDFRIDSAEGYDAQHAIFSATLAPFGRNLMALRSNFYTLLRPYHWEHLSGGALASLALALENRWGRAVLASDWNYGRAQPVGTHPMTTPLWSTTSLTFIHDGGGYSRFEKIEVLAGFEFALNNMRVCIRREPGNCSRCPKCLRTMIALDALGVLPAARAFDATHYQKDLRAMSPRPTDRGTLLDVHARAVQIGRADLVEHSTRLLNRLDRTTRRARVEWALSEWVMPARAARLVGSALDWGYLRFRRLARRKD